VCATYQTHLLCLIFNPPLVWVFWLDNGAPTKTIQGENSSSGRSAPDVSLHGYFAQAHWIVTGERGQILKDEMKWQNKVTRDHCAVLEFRDSIPISIMRTWILIRNLNQTSLHTNKT
jgi:hypothetical protein